MMTAGIRHLRSELEISERKRLRLQRIKLFEPGESEDFNLWAMLDLMTLILAFFVILYSNSLSEINPDQSQQNLSPPAIADVIPPGSLPNTRLPERAENDLLIMQKRMTQAMKGMNISDYSIKIKKDRIMLVIGEKISFTEGKADLLDPIKEPLKKMAKVFNTDYTYRIVVSGHTDDTPIHTEEFPSNWELSVARALTVAKYLMSRQVDPERIAIEGFGQYRPVADNYFYKGRQANRRVEISLIKDLRY